MIFGTALEVINICGTEDFTVTLVVNASTAIGGACSDSFQFIPPPVS